MHCLKLRVFGVKWVAVSCPQLNKSPTCFNVQADYSQ